MDKKVLPLNENKHQSLSQAAPSSSEADLLYSQSLSLLNNAIEECQLDGFQTVESTVPQILDQQGMMTNTSPNETDFFSLAKQLFEQQAPLFSHEILEQQELTDNLTDTLEAEQLASTNDENTFNIMPEEQAQSLQIEQGIEKPIDSNSEQSVNNDAGLDAINELLNSG